MKKASIVTIGNEILSGKTVDTNASYLCSRLLSIGIPVVASYTVPDEIDAIMRTLNLAIENADVVIVTGGLGPTDDDVTRQAIAKAIGRKLELKENLLKEIKEFFASRNREMVQKNIVQAYLPAGTESLTNEIGTAPGIVAEVKGKWIFALPGVPSEMKRMFEESVSNRLETSCSGQAVIVRMLRCFGTGESNIAEMLGDLMERGRNPLINCTAGSGIITLTIIGIADCQKVAEQMVEQEEQIIRDRLGTLVFGSGDDTLATIVGKKLSAMNKTIAVAESCTGGLLGKLLTDVPGSSKYFTHGWITYSNQAKISELGVDSAIIDRFGAVSEQVCVEMARGARKRATTDFAIGITGIAGPDGGTEQKPAGLIYISIDSVEGCQTKRLVLPGARDSVRFRTAQTALNLLLRKLQI
jgi:nicotinamide-nucleotide amidase